jgi:uncharacterized damage-inducible protein DinB
MNLKDRLHDYLRQGRGALLWKLEGLSEYDLRRPLTPTGSNLLGIVKHTASMDAEYFGPCFGRPHGLDLHWLPDSPETNADFWATPEESKQDIVDLYERAAANSDATIGELDLDSVGTVPWWNDGQGREVTLGWILAHMIAETHRHAGHVDIVRELIDENVGHRREVDNMWQPTDGWPAYRARLQTIAEQFTD